MKYNVVFIFLDEEGAELTSRDENVYADTYAEAIEKAEALRLRYGADEFDTLDDD